MNSSNSSLNLNAPSSYIPQAWPPLDFKKIDEKYICPKCKGIFINVHQADDCGCRYCLECLNELIAQEDPKCLICDSKILNSRLPDKHFQKNKINKLEVECEFREKNDELESKCTWKGSLSAYVEHYGEHLSSKIKICEYCQKEFKLKHEYENHLNKINGDCVKQPLQCMYASIGCSIIDSFLDTNSMDIGNSIEQKRLCLTRENLEAHMNLNQMRHLDLVFSHLNKRIEAIQLELKEKHVENLINNSPIKLINSSFSTKTKNDSISESYSNLRSSTGSYVVPGNNEIRLITGENAVNTNETLCMLEEKLEPRFIDLNTKLDILENNQKSLINDLTRITKSNDILRQENLKYKESIKEYKTLCQDLHRTMALTQVSLLTLEERLINQEKLSYNGSLLWKITNVQERIQEAKSGRQTSFYSPPFYTDRNGFKMCARIYLNGDGNGRNTHLSLFFVILRGEYDALLKWPFRQKVTFILIDQSLSESKENVYDAFRPDPNSSSFRRPVSEMNIASGLPVFCPLGKLLSDDHEYIKDNTMFIKIIVDTKDLSEI